MRLWRTADKSLLNYHALRHAPAVQDAYGIKPVSRLQSVTHFATAGFRPFILTGILNYPSAGFT